MPYSPDQIKIIEENEKFWNLNLLLMRNDIAKIFHKMSKNLDLKPVLIRISRDHHDKLEEISLEYSIPKSTLARTAIADYIAKEYIKVHDRKKARLEAGIN